MNITRFNWQIWAGVLLSIFAMLSYPFIFVEWPLTRDFPWANILLFALAAVFVFTGVRRAFGAGRGWFSKIGATVLAVFSALVVGLLIMLAFVSATWLPAAAGAPKIGQTAPDFTLADDTGRQVSLNELLTKEIESPVTKTVTKPRGVLLIFYRGYW